jgi:hypothetical protein
MTDFRALCAELTDTLDYWLKNSNLTDSDARDLVQNARAALAQPEPGAELAAKLIAESKPMDLEMAAALTTEARWGLYEGSLTPHPEPVAPTDEELDELKDDYWWLDANHSKPWIPFARAVLERYGTPAIEPVPVSERLPGPEDCDAEGRCWWFVPEDDEQPSNWYLDGQPPAREIRFYGNTHWLPHYALPTPRSGTH